MLISELFVRNESGDVGRTCVRCGAFHADVAKGFYRQAAGRGGFQVRCKKCARATASKPPTVTRECANCGKSFAASAHRIRFAQKNGRVVGVCCSPECRTAHRRDPQKRLVSECVRCGVGFTWYASTPIPRKYCSKECAGTKTDPVDVACKTCGKVIQLSPAQAKYRRFCSRECVSAGATVSPPHRSRLCRARWQRIRAKVLARDRNRCVSCGCVGGALHVHHVIPWRDSRDDSLSNLQTLCGSCHAAAEWRVNPRFGPQARAVAC